MSKDKVANLELHPLFIVIQGGIRAYMAVDELWVFDFFFLMLCTELGQQCLVEQYRLKRQW